ncbi:MAG: sensor histidine kinase, partial [Intestinibacter sp.]
IKTGEKINYDDINSALAGNEGYNISTYNIAKTKDHVMSISVPIKIGNSVEGVVRYSISLNEVDNVIIRMGIGIFIGGMFILCICFLLSLRFADSLIKPIQDLKKTANQLAQGNYNIALSNEKLHDDEIGDLVRTFEHMAKEIDKTRKLKEEFISSVSHELRTPLTSIKGWSETLSYEGISKEELDLGLGIIQDETERLITLVEELLDFSRLASDRIRLQIGNVNVAKLAKDVVNQLGVKAREKNITLLTEFKTKERDIVEIQGDKNRLRQVLINLVQNAIKFTEDGGYVVVRLSQGEEYTTFSVDDNGIGIKKENLDKVLEKFFQEDYNKSGSGIGLAISNEIIKLHKGKMILESEKGQGTNITFTLKNNLIDAIAE